MARATARHSDRINALAVRDPDAAIQAILDDPDDWARKYLEAFINHYGNDRQACIAAGVHHKTVTARIQHDQTFAALHQDAREHCRDAVLYELNRRAMEPSERPVYHRGELVDTILEYDNRLLMWLAERLDPEHLHLPLVVQFVSPDEADFTFRMGEEDRPLELPPGDVVDHDDEPA